VGDTGVYLYAVARGVSAEQIDGVVGLSGGEVRLLDHDGLVAVASNVDLDEYGEEGLRANLERLEWLEPTARTHDAVIKAVADVAPVAPMRLATIFLDDESLLRRVGEWHDDLVRVLDRVDGRHEWSVKVIRPPDPEPAAAAQSRPASGAAYLIQKKAQGDQRAAQDAETLLAAQRVHDDLAGLAAASRVLSPQDPRLTGHLGTMVLNAAYLVDSTQGQAFAERVQSCMSAYEALDIAVGGPWPPYSFAMLEQG
jgi:hypothetical protein